MLIGYARVSTNDQETATQVAALKAAGCERIYREKASGGRWDRPELHRLLDQLREDDVLVVWKLDRLSRSLRDVLTIMERLTEIQGGLPQPDRSDRHDDAGGRMMMQMVGAFRGIRKGHVAGADEGGSGFRSPGRTHRRTPAKADASTTVRDQEDGFKRPQDRGRRCTPIQSSPCHRLATAGAGLRQIACKETFCTPSNAPNLPVFRTFLIKYVRRRPCTSRMPRLWKVIAGDAGKCYIEI